MTGIASPKAPELSAIQIAWLQEIGIDKRMLAQYAPDRGPFPAAGSQVRQAQGQPAQVSHDSSDAPEGKAGSGLVRASTVLEGGVPAGADAQAASAVVNLSALIKKGSGASPRAAPLDDGVKNAEPKAAAAISTEIPHDMEALQVHIEACQICDLHSGRSQTVFGSGVVQSPAWLIVGEAPGELDDRVGLPFQGRPGVLLQAMLASIGVEPEAEVFFTNLVKCRPLGNRTPEPQEIAACMPYLQRQIALLQPHRILALGKLAAQALLGVNAELEQLRGQVHHVRTETGLSIPLIATYHPASLLLRPQHKADAWVDLNLAKSAHGKP